MSFELNAAFSLSAGLAAIIGWVRFRKTDPTYLPFLFLIWLGFLNEILSIIIMKSGYSNAIYYNSFALTEAILITWQFKKWGLFRNQSLLFYFIQFIFISSWITETIIRGEMNEFNSYFIIGFSGLIVMMAINVLNNIIFKEPSLLLLNPIFLICTGLVIYFTYSNLTEVFWLYGLNSSSTFRIRIYEIFAYINLFTNLVFAFAILWIPMKRQYILQS